MLVRSVFDIIRSQFTRPLNRRMRRSSTRRFGAGQLQCLESLEGRQLLTFNLAVNYAVATGPQVVTADFNGDGRLDIATANSSSNNVSVLLGNAGGTFQPAQNSATGTQPLSLAVGDFNEDGKLDLATANDGDLSVLLGNGNGTFQAPTSIGVAANQSVAVGDFNGDGNLDLGVTSNIYVFDGCGYYGGCYSHYEGRANVLLGTGTGSFSAPIASYLGYGNHTSAAVADFNSDGKLDFASANLDNGSVDVLLGTGIGTFSAPTGFLAGYSNSVAAGDVNTDGKIDLVTANPSGNISVVLGNGLGSFGSAQNYVAGSTVRSLAMADFNGDAHIDLVTANWEAGTVSVLLGTGTGTGAFKPPVNAVTAAGPIGVAVGDFNGDGRADVATANPSSNNVSVLLNDGTWPVLDAPSITINDVTVTEGNTATTATTFTVSLSAAYGNPVTVHYATADGSATLAGGDYQATYGTLTFAPGGPLTQTVTVLVNGDRDYEYNESFYVRLTDSTSAFIADATGMGTILDDEPSISIEPYESGLEGNTGTTAFTFTVTLSAVYDATVTVAYATADLTPDEEYWNGPGATAGVDYTATTGTLTILAGQTSGTITVLVNGDRLVESDELFFVNLSNPTSAHLGSSLAVATIVDDEPYVSIGEGGTVVEGHSGTKSMTFTVTVSAASDTPVTVTYATGDGSATAGSDYEAKTGTVTFAAGETSKTITVLVNGDRLGESDESFYVSLTGATDAHISNGYGSGTIQDDEPRISISDVSKAEGKRRETTLFTFTVTLSAAYDQAVTMSFRTVNGTATSGSGDYLAKTGTLTFAAGETTKTITIEVKGDSKREGNETFYLDLFGNSVNSLFGKNRGIGRILNDD